MVRPIDNTLGKYIDRGRPRDGIQACAGICVEVDLGKGLLGALQLIVDKWIYLQHVDYEQFPFKCKSFHEYDHFAKNCPKVVPGKEVLNLNEQWQQLDKERQADKLGSQAQQGKPSTGPHPPGSRKGLNSPGSNNNKHPIM